MISKVAERANGRPDHRQRDLLLRTRRSKRRLLTAHPEHLRARRAGDATQRFGRSARTSAAPAWRSPAAISSFTGEPCSRQWPECILR